MMLLTICLSSAHATPCTGGTALQSSDTWLAQGTYGLYPVGVVQDSDGDGNIELCGKIYSPASESILVLACYELSGDFLNSFTWTGTSFTTNSSYITWHFEGVCNIDTTLATCSNGVLDVDEMGIDCGEVCDTQCLFGTVPVETDLPQDVGSDFRLSTTINLGSIVPTEGYPAEISIIDSNGVPVTPSQTCTGSPCNVSAVITDQPAGENTYTIIVEHTDAEGNTVTSSGTVTTTVRDQTLVDLIGNQSEIIQNIVKRYEASPVKPDIIRIGSRRIPIVVFSVNF